MMVGRRWGMTVVEAAIVVLALGVVLFVLGGVARWTRQQAKDRLAWRMLGALDQALGAYYRLEGAYPPGRQDGEADDAVAALLSRPGSASKLASLPAALRGRGGAGAKLLDPWARRLRYLTERFDDSGRVAANGGRPIFLLADGRGTDEASIR